MVNDNEMEDIKEEAAPPAEDIGQLDQKLEDKLAERAQDPDEIAATLYSLFWPKLKGALASMSKKQLLRHINSIYEVPLIVQTPHLPNEFEKSAFEMGDRIMQGKMALVISTLFGDKSLSQVSIDETAPKTENNEEKGTENV